MKLIVGLGNPGKEYQKTPHNVGFIFLDTLKEKLGIFEAWQEDNMFESLLAETKSGEGIVLMRPLTFMNNSGRAVSKYMSKKNIDVADLIVVHDDLDIALGKYKIQFEKSPKAHNGITSIERRIGNQFLRVRIGIEARKDRSIPGEDYVLKNMYPDQLQLVHDISVQICDELIKNYLKI